MFNTSTLIDANARRQSNKMKLTVKVNVFIAGARSECLYSRLLLQNKILGAIELFPLTNLLEYSRNAHKNS